MSRHHHQPIRTSSESSESSPSSSTSSSSSPWPSETSSVARTLSSITLSPSSVHSLSSVTTSSSEWSTGSSSRSPLPSVLGASSSTIARPYNNGLTPLSAALYLPAEVLQHIFSFLSRQDLLRVIFVSKRYRGNGNMILYQHIDLANDDPYVDSTMDILKNPPTLSKGIVHAKLTTRASGARWNAGSGARWVQPDFFQNSTNLRSLHLRGCPFSDLQQWQTFVQTLQRVCVNLGDFQFEHMADGITLGDFPLSGLTRFSWHPESDMRWPLQPLLLSSGTLTSVAFHGRVEHVKGNAFDQLLSMNLPKLTSIDLGCLVSALADTNSKVTQFLFHHPLLERLSLGHENPHPAESNVTYRIQLPADVPSNNIARQGFLPNVYHLECFPVTLTSLINQRAPFLSGITSLSLATIRNGFNDITLLQNAHAAHPDASMLFAAVRHLRFQFPVKHKIDFRLKLYNGTIEEREFWTDLQNYSSQRQLRLMTWTANQFSEITSWEGDLPPMQSSALASFFASYAPGHLKTISVPQKTLLHADPKNLVAFFEPLACKCPTLKRVVGRKPKYSEKTVDNIFTFIRNGTLLSKVIMEAIPDATELII